MVEPIVSKDVWENCQYQKKRNARHYERTATYLFTNKLKCSKCGSFLGGAASKKKSGKKYYYYKCEHCKTYFSEDKLEEKLLDTFIKLQEQESLLNDYYTPFIKSKLDKHTTDYNKELKELDKQLDRIKTAYIKGVLKIEAFDNDIKQIEFRKQELDRKILEEKQYENMSFTVDDLLIFQDHQQVKYLTNPSEYLNLVSNWIMLDKKSKQRIISHYIDSLEVERIGEDIIINKTNLLMSYLNDQFENHKEYKTPFNFDLLEDDDGNPNSNILIDDDIYNLEEWKQNGGISILFNKHMKNIDSYGNKSDKFIIIDDLFKICDIIKNR